MLPLSAGHDAHFAEPPDPAFGRSLIPRLRSSQKSRSLDPALETNELQIAVAHRHHKVLSAEAGG